MFCKIDRLREYVLKVTKCWFQYSAIVFDKKDCALNYVWNDF